LLQNEEESEYLGWLDLVKTKEKRALLVTDNYLVVLKESGRLIEKAHLVDILRLQSFNPQEVEFLDIIK
jgi:hypothetical protein